MIEVFSGARDDVIKSTVAIAKTNYLFALAKLFPLLDRFGEQRKTQTRKFYARLRKDIITGCIMPPITLAFVDKKLASETNPTVISEFINQSIDSGYILDGMQRLTTLQDASSDESFDNKRPIFMNVIIAERYDLLLYRMITLNNGQKPMTARHQIEMLTKGVVDLSNIPVQVVTEKETEGTKIHGAFRKSDVVEAYTAFLTDSVNNQNSKIIETKLDEITVTKVMESDLTESPIAFSDILAEVGRLSADPVTRDWMRQVNNLIGFTVGVKKSLGVVQEIQVDDFSAIINTFEKAFESINPSKVNVGKFRRQLSSYYFSKLSEFKDADVSDVDAAFFEQTLAE
jgi:hypothetical protein